MASANTTETDAEPTVEDLIEGPFIEPVEQGGASYYRCADCGRESLRRGDLKRDGFHADGCAAGETND